MKVGGIESFFLSIDRDIIVTDHYIFVSCGIGRYCFYDDAICYGEYGCPYRSTNIDSEVSSRILSIVMSIVAHIGCDVGIVKYSRCFCTISCIEKCERVIERYGYILFYIYVFEAF